MSGSTFIISFLISLTFAFIIDLVISGLLKSLVRSLRAFWSPKEDNANSSSSVDSDLHTVVKDMLLMFVICFMCATAFWSLMVLIYLLCRV